AIVDVQELPDHLGHDGEVAQVRAELVALARFLDLGPELHGLLVLAHALEEAARARGDQRELLLDRHRDELLQAVSTVEELLLALRVDERLLLARAARRAVGRRAGGRLAWSVVRFDHAWITPSSGPCGGQRCDRRCGRGACRA